MDLLAAGAELERIDHPEKLWAEAIQTFQNLGFPFYIYLTVNKDLGSVFLRTNIPEIYEDTDPADDPFLHYCCSSYEITKTGLAYLPSHNISTEAKKFIRSASKITRDGAQSGFETGLGIPVRLEDAPLYGGFNLGCSLPVDEFEREIMPHSDQIRLYCLLLHRRLDEFKANTNSLADLLSRREHEVMEYLAQGKSRKECAAILNLSPNTVAEYSKSAYKKLGARNRTEAARKFLG